MQAGANVNAATAEGVIPLHAVLANHMGGVSFDEAAIEGEFSPLIDAVSLDNLFLKVCSFRLKVLKWLMNVGAGTTWGCKELRHCFGVLDNLCVLAGKNEMQNLCMLEKGVPLCESSIFILVVDVD